MNADALIEKANAEFDAGRNDQAISILSDAVKIAPNNATAWWHLALKQRWSGKVAESEAAFRSAIKLNPRSARLWIHFAGMLQELNRLDDAQKAVTQAERFNDGDVHVWRGAARFYAERKMWVEQAEALEFLRSAGEGNASDLHQLGFAYHMSKHFDAAIDAYLSSAKLTKDTATLFNIGLICASSEVSRDLDAADFFRWALHRNPDDGPAKKAFASVPAKIENLAEKTRAYSTFFSYRDPAAGEKDWYEFYLNPIQLLQLGEAITSDGTICSLDPKPLQRAKKVLLAEIELGEGAIPWLGGVHIDRSRALALSDELLSSEKLRFHYYIWVNTRLNAFLSTGAIDLFRYSCAEPQHECIRRAWEITEYRLFLSEPFARQYNRVLGAALEKKIIPVIEVLFDGRLWVCPEHVDLCYENARHLVEDLVSRLELLAKTKPEPAQVEAHFKDAAVVEILNLLPAYFRLQQARAAGAIRSLAIAAHNEHGETDASMAILRHCRSLHFKDAALRERLEDDFKALQEIIQEQRKHEVKLNFGERRPFHITKDGIRESERFMPADKISGMRWGTMVSGTIYAPVYEFHIAFVDESGTTIAKNWRSDGEDRQTQKEFFSKMVGAALNYVAPLVDEKVRTHLAGGREWAFGAATADGQGLKFTTQGLIFSKQHHIPWSRLTSKVENGDVVVSERSSPKVAVTVPLRDIWNAFLLDIYVKAGGPNRRTE